MNRSLDGMQWNPGLCGAMDVPGFRYAASGLLFVAGMMLLMGMA
ncbi:MAG: hypothetical protein ACYC1F_04470 [Gallionellaceae bacterium]|jgi:hypothetical protein